MTHILVDSIINGFPSPYLPNKQRKPDFSGIFKTYCLLTENAGSIEFPLGGGQNGYFGLVLMESNYTLIIMVPFGCP